MDGQEVWQMHIGERRRTPRGSQQGEPPRAHLRSLILSAYHDMPGLNLTLEQAARLFGIRDRTCQVLFEDLVRDGRLRRSTDGRYARQ
jgi:hypothetical protein